MKITLELATGSVSPSDAASINNIIKEHFPGSPVEVSFGGSIHTAAGTGCTEACNLAQGVAEAACDRLGGVAAVVCKLAAKAAGDYCRSRC